MASTMNLMRLMFFLTVTGKGMCFQLCPNDGVIIDQDRTGKVIQGIPEWWLRLSIDCPCPQVDVKLTCPGFQPEEGPDPSVFKMDGDTCIIIPPVTIPNPVTVTYVADTGYPFSLDSSSAKC